MENMPADDGVWRVDNVDHKIKLYKHNYITTYLQAIPVLITSVATRIPYAH